MAPLAAAPKLAAPTPRKMAVDMDVEPTDDEKMAGYLSTIESGEASDDESIKAKEAAVLALSALYAKRRESEKLAALLVTLRPLFAAIPKAKTAKLVKRLIEDVAKIPGTEALQMRLCRDAIEWCTAEKRSYLRQRIQARLASLLLDSKQYTDALALLTELLREVKRLDDKQLLVDIFLVEAQTHHALRNLPKATASLTAARTNANAIYCPPLQQAQIDLMAGSLQAENGDFKTAFSYFYEAFENFDTIGDATSVSCVKYMLLSKIMLSLPDDVNALVQGKPGQKAGGPPIEAMSAVAAAHKERSLHDFEAALAAHHAELGADPIIAHHLAALYDILMQENILRLLEPYSVVETAHVASLIKLPLEKVEEKLSKMILDKKLKGILDAGAGCLILYDEAAADSTYEQALETLGNMGKVVDALYSKANLLAAPPKAKEEEKDAKKDGKEKDGKDGEKTLVKKKDKK